MNFLIFCEGAKKMKKEEGEKTISNPNARFFNKNILIVKIN